MKNIEELCYENRCLRTWTGGLLFGPSGERLSVDILERKFGFTGTIDFIHKMNITQLFEIECGSIHDYRDAKIEWFPTYMRFEYRKSGLSCQETKIILDDDLAISILDVKNERKDEVFFEIKCEPFGFSVENRTRKDKKFYTIYAESPEIRFGISVGIVLIWNQQNRRCVIKSGEEKRIITLAVVGNINTETEQQLWEKLDLVWSKIEHEDFEERLKEQNAIFYETAPSFVCDDEMWNRCWKYRWYILKNTMSRPGVGKFHETVMYEGRDHRMKKTPMKPQGWEFSKLIPLSTPLHINDMRWHTDKSIVKEMIRSVFQAQDEKGLVLCSYIKTQEKSYANYLLWAIWLFYLIEPDKKFVKELLPKMKKYIEGHEYYYQDNKDGLLIERKHSLTGKEYQPSYWYFYQYPDNPKDPDTYTPLKRVDRSVYHYLNLKGLANLMKELGDPDYVQYEKKAHRLKKDINDKMWDPQTGFYYDLHYITEEKAYVKNIVGIYPYWAELSEKEQGCGIEKLMNPDYFNLGYAFPSVSKDCPVFAPDGGWKGYFFKGRNGCVWCGPSWPYTTGIALEALGNQSRCQNHKFDKDFDQFLQEYTIQHFRDGDINRPYLVEHYNPISGERLSDEVDYNHSFWLDIIITYVAGVIVEPDKIRIDPLETHLEWFELDDLWIKGHKIKISYDKRSDTETALKVYIDNREIDIKKCNEIIL